MTKFKSRNGLLGGIEFTETQGKLMSLLEDGEPHTFAQMCSAIDVMTTARNVSWHVAQIRKLIRGRGLGVVCVIHNRKAGYRLVRLISKDD